jgi:acyl carrier protein
MDMDADLNKIIGIVETAGEIDGLAPDQDIYKAGLSSLKAMDVMLDLETEFNVSVPDDQFVQARTPSALLDLVRRLQAA